MATQSLQTHSAAEKVGPNGRGSNEGIKLVRDDQSPSIELSLGIDATSFKPLTSRNTLSCGVQGVQSQSFMDPEPGRCRRTDGKKWRCRRDVLPDQKYCERHMHRGRQRSRKPVEVLKATSDSKPTKTSSNSSIKVLVKCPKTGKPSRTFSTEGIVRTSGKAHVKDETIAKQSSFNASNGNNQSSKTPKSNQASEFGSSPKSVLQHGNGTSSNHHNSTPVEAEPQRCRRTDGKKWRCSKEVITEQKYCAQHMNRGSKKPKKIEINQNLKNSSLVICTGSSQQKVTTEELHLNGPSSTSSSSDDENDSHCLISSSSSSAEEEAAADNVSSSSEATTISV